MYGLKDKLGNFVNLNTYIESNMKKTVILLTVSLVSIFMIAQKKERNAIGGFEKAFYFEKNKSFENCDVIIKNIVDYDGGVKFALKITNTTSDFLIFNPEQSKIIVDGKKIQAEGKTKLIAASKTKSQTIHADRGSAKRQEAFSFLFAGLSILKEDKKAIEVEDFEIPMERKDFSFDDVSCKVSIPVRKSQKMTVKVSMKNTGDKYIIVHPYRVGVEMPDEKTYSSKNTKEAIVLAPHSEKTMTLKWDRMPKGNLNDMQKVDMGIDFTDVFFYAVEESLASENIEIKWDKNLTIEKK